MSDNVPCVLVLLIVCTYGCVTAWIDSRRGGGGS
jgi:hypothetical protein